MAKTNAFKIAELIRGIQFDVDNDEITTTKKVKSKDRTSGATTKTATTEFALDTFAKADFRAARYVVAMSSGSDFHSTEIVVIHDGSSVTLTQYGTLKSSSLATFDADVNSGNVRVKATPSSSSSTTFKISKTLTKV